MPEYPDATDLKPEELARNHQQFHWFTDECAKRNIRVLLHFYQIHLPLPLAQVAEDSDALRPSRTISRPNTCVTPWAGS